MKYVRIYASAFLVLLGVAMIVVWGVTLKSVEAIDNGQAAGKLTSKVLASPEIADAAADKALEQIHELLKTQIDSAGFELVWFAAQQPIHDAIVSVIGSDVVATTAQAGADRVQVALVAALAEDDRPHGPLVLSVDISPRLNARIDIIPTVGALIPDISVPPLEVEVIEADTFEDMRTAYSAATFAANWFMWIGLVMIVAGVAVSARRQWFFTRAMAVAGALGIVLGLIVGTTAARTIAGLVPGGADGGLGTAVNDLLSDTAIAPIANLLLAVGMIALVLAVLTPLALRHIPVLRERTQRTRMNIPAVTATTLPLAVILPDAGLDMGVDSLAKAPTAEVPVGTKSVAKKTPRMKSAGPTAT